jgi:RCC1 and BTB domain-containing protein
LIVKELCSKKTIDLSFGHSYCIARTEDKKIYCWGRNESGQLANGRRDIFLSLSHKPQLNSLLSDLNIDIRCGFGHSIALTNNGRVYAWVLNNCGQIDSGRYLVESRPLKLDAFEEEIVIMISCGALHSMTLTKKLTSIRLRG